MARYANQRIPDEDTDNKFSVDAVYSSSDKDFMPVVKLRLASPIAHFYKSV